MIGSETARSILIVRIGRLGDFLVALPAMAALRRRYPRHRIVLLTALSASRRSVATAKRYTAAGALPWVEWVRPRWVDETIVVDDLWSFRTMLDVAARLRQHDVERAFVLPFHGETSLGGRKKSAWLRLLGYWGPVQPRPAAPEPARPGCPRQVQAPLDYVLGPAAVAEAEAARGAATLTAAAADREWAAAAWPDLGRRRVALFPAATFAHKQWPVERFAELVARLEGEDGCEVALIGSRADRETAEQVRARSGGCGENFCGRTTLGQLAALLQRAELLAGNDGGPAHLAAAFGVPTVTVMSGVHPAGVWDPGGARSVAVRSGPLPCLGCGGEFACRVAGNPCMTTIPAAAVLAACREVLGPARSAGA